MFNDTYSSLFLGSSPHLLTFNPPLILLFLLGSHPSIFSFSLTVKVANKTSKSSVLCFVVFSLKYTNQIHAKLRMHLTRGCRCEYTKQMYCRFMVRHVLALLLFLSALNESQWFLLFLLEKIFSFPWCWNAVLFFCCFLTTLRKALIYFEPFVTMSISETA